MKILATQLSEADKQRVIIAASVVIPWIAGVGWTMVEEFANGARYLSDDGIKVISEVEAQQVKDGKRVWHELWLHVSFSRAGSMPSYEDMVRVKERFIGADRKAIQVLPAKSEHFNHHEFCLNLFSPLDRDPLPDFRTADGKL